MIGSATNFPPSKHTGGGDSAPAFSGPRVYLQFTWEVGLPPSPVESFLPTTTFTSFPAFDCCACAAAPAFSSPTCLFTVPCGISPALLFSVQGALPSLLHVFFLLLLIIQFFFPWMGVGLSRGYADLSQGCLWEYHMTLSSPSGLGTGIWWHRSPPGFSI
jgi:hypothetical protein